MNRRDEYESLLRELEETPENLETTVERALKRKRASQKTWRLLGIPAGSLAACFLVFILLVNLFPTFARACGSVPVLRELAKAVAWSPSLSAAVENEYVQPIGQSQTENGVTATMEYVIVDRKKASFFYTLEFGEALGDVYADYGFGDLHGWAGTSGSSRLESGELTEIDIDFVDQDVPDTLELTLKVYTQLQRDEMENYKDSLFDEPACEEPNYVAEFLFHLEFDPYFTAQGEIIPVDTAFNMDDQAFTLTEVELYPTHLRVNLDDDPDNTAWLEGLDLYLENEHGERFESGINGITASGDPDGEGYATFWLDSPFFSQGEHLTLHITRAKWRDKAGTRVRVDLAGGTAEGLPEGISLLKTERREDGWIVYFTAPREPGGGMYSLFNGTFWDDAGNEHRFWQRGASYGYQDQKTGEYVDDGTTFTMDFPLGDFDGNVVYLDPWFDHVTSFETPITIPIK